MFVLISDKRDCKTNKQKNVPRDDQRHFLVKCQIYQEDINIISSLLLLERTKMVAQVNSGICHLPQPYKNYN